MSLPFSLYISILLPKYRWSRRRIYEKNVVRQTTSIFDQIMITYAYASFDWLLCMYLYMCAALIYRTISSFWLNSSMEMMATNFWMIKYRFEYLMTAINDVCGAVAGVQFWSSVCRIKMPSIEFIIEWNSKNCWTALNAKCRYDDDNVRRMRLRQSVVHYDKSMWTANN